MATLSRCARFGRPRSVVAGMSSRAVVTAEHGPQRMDPNDSRIGAVRQRSCIIYWIPIYNRHAMHPIDFVLRQGHSTTLVLALLADGESHGYQLRKDLAARTHHYFQFPFGSLYPLLQRLEKQGLTHSQWKKVGRSRQQNATPSHPRAVPN